MIIRLLIVPLLQKEVCQVSDSMTFKYRVTFVSSAFKEAGQKVMVVKTKCVTCDRHISNYIDRYTVEQLIEGENWACYPYKIVCSEICANMCILSALDEGKAWIKRLSGRWTVDTPSQMQAVFGLDKEQALIDTLAGQLRKKIDDKIVEDLNKMGTKQK